MLISEAIKVLEDFGKDNGIAVAFSHFTGEVTPPYMVYLVPTTDNFNADNITYQVIRELEVELYTRENTLQTESLLENAMTYFGFAWDKTSQTWIDEDKVFMSVYTLGDFLNG